MMNATPPRVGPNRRKLTKHKVPGKASHWAVHADGHDTGLRISKGDTPRWGQSQEWDVTDAHDDDKYLFSARGVSLAMDRLDTIALSVAWAGFQ
jgi:hypothetical protein